MWLMTTKGRPKAAEKTLAACWATGMKQAGIVYVDGDPAGYDDITLPDNWEMVKGRGNLAGSKQYIFKHYPNERCYGWVADDNYPETPYWSYMVEELAHPWRLVHCRDSFISDLDYANVSLLMRTRNLGGGICWGGDLIRAVGWWAPPGIIQGSIDWAWTSLVGDTPLGLYVQNISVRHDNWRTGRRDQDDNDNLQKPHVKADVTHVGNLIKSEEFQKVRERLVKQYEQYVTGQA